VISDNCDMVTSKGEPIAVLDTNVVLDLFSWHDFHDHFGRRVTWASANNVRLDDPQSRMRMARAREALLLAIYLHKTRAITFSISEAERLVIRVSQFDAKGKPLSDDERGYKEAFVKTFLWFVKERLLVGWQDAMEVTDAEGNDADDILLAHAKKKSLPLITNEGFTATGVDRKNRMRRKAKKEGVQIVRAADFYHDKMDVEVEAKAFFRRFRAETPKYLKWYLKKHGRGKGAIQRILRDLDRYYDFILSNDPNAPRIKPIKRISP